jgi:hypothetical protein
MVRAFSSSFIFLLIPLSERFHAIISVFFFFFLNLGFQEFQHRFVPKCAFTKHIDLFSTNNFCCLLVENLGLECV